MGGVFEGFFGRETLRAFGVQQLSNHISFPGLTVILERHHSDSVGAAVQIRKYGLLFEHLMRLEIEIFFYENSLVILVFGGLFRGV